MKQRVSTIYQCPYVHDRVVMVRTRDQHDRYAENVVCKTPDDLDVYHTGLAVQCPYFNTDECVSRKGQFMDFSR